MEPETVRAVASEWQRGEKKVSEAVDHADLAKYERDVLSRLVPENDDLLEVDDEIEQRPVQTQAVAAPAAVVASPKAESGEQEPHQGSLNAALRASRAAERRGREAVAKLEQDIADLRARHGEPESKQGDDLQQDLEELAENVPQAAKLIKSLQERLDAVAPKEATPQATAFEPEYLEPAAEDVVDTIPELSKWRNTEADQDKWHLAKSMDAVLFQIPSWRAKPPAERLAEAVRRVNAEMGTPSATTAPVVKARSLSLSDLRGGLAPTNTGEPNYRSMKTDAEVMAALNRMG